MWLWIASWLLIIATGQTPIVVSAATTEPMYTAAQIQQLNEALAMNNQGFLACQAGRFAEAIACAQKSIALRKAVLGDSHPHYALSVHNLGDFCRESSDFAKAEPAYVEAMAAYKRALGDQSFEYARSAEHLANMHFRKKEYAKAEPFYLLAAGIYRKAGDQDPQYYSALSWLALAYEEMAQSTKAESLYLQLMEIERARHGDQHVDFAVAMSNLALHYVRAGEYTKAELFLLREVEIKRKVLGEQNADYAEALTSLAKNYGNTGRYEMAEPLARRAVEIKRKAVGERNPSFEKSLTNLAVIYAHLGEYGKAESLYIQALEICKSTLGETHPEYAIGLNNLAVLYVEIGNPAKAEQLYLRSLEIDSNFSGKLTPGYASTLGNLSELYHRSGDYSRAVVLDLQSLEIARITLGEKHPQYALALNHLAESYRGLRDYTKAEPLYLQSLEIERGSGAEHHPIYADSLHNLALMYRYKGDYAKAEPLFLQALEIDKKVFGQQNIINATKLKNLALLYALKGDPSQAESLGRQTLTILREHMERVAVLQSERQQLEFDRNCRGNFNAYLTYSDLAKTPAAQVYREVANWKGTVWLRQRQMRELRHLKAGDALGVSKEDHREASRLCDELTIATGALGKAFSTPLDPRLAVDPVAQRARSEQIAGLSETINQLQSDLSRRSENYRNLLRQTRRTTDELAAALPEGTALVDMFEYARTILRKQKDQPDVQEPWLVAFIIRRGKAVERVELGPAKLIDYEVERWREGKIEETADARSAGRELRRVVWQPLAEKLGGATSVMISPDGPLARLSFAALPGEKSGTYLIEEFAFSIVAVPQALPELLASTPAAGPPSILIVGDVDYGIPDAKGQSIAPPLPGTKVEMQAIKTLFQSSWPTGNVQTLHGEGATKSAFHALASSRWIHLATHGYFAAPPEKAATLADAGPSYANLHPGLLSGVILAGVNRSPAGGTNEGILTALEVQEMDLGQVDMAVLSACETGMGLTAGGEGMLGLQRAFQVGGARTVVASLWSADDRSTQQLMTRFYQNLWTSHMGKLQALREAQLQMLRGPQGMLLTPRRLPPKYWAAFVLSGDGR